MFWIPPTNMSPSSPAPNSGPSFEEVVREHEREIYRLILLQVNDAEIADDLTQETFLSAYRYFSARKTGEEVHFWLCRIALEHVKRHFRAGAFRTRPDEGASE